MSDDLILGRWATMLLWGMLGRCEHADTVRVRMAVEGAIEIVQVEAVWEDGTSATGYAREDDRLIVWEIGLP